MSKMKALVKKKAERGLWLDEVPFPTIKPNEVLIRVKKASICGTDLHIYAWDEWAQRNVPVGTTIGHEFVGEIVELGQCVSGWTVGQRVCGEGHLTCGTCRPCREGDRHLCPNTKGVGYSIVNGCFAEYIALPAENLFGPASFVADDMAAIFDPFGNAVHTAMTYPLTGEDVLITGAGPIGLMAVAISKHAGARNVVITDINPKRLKMAEMLGATRAVNVKEQPLLAAISDLRLSEGFTVSMEMSGTANGINEIMNASACGGKIALLGILPPNTAIDWNKVIFKLLNIKGIYGREIFRTWHQCEALLEGGLDISSLLTHRFPLEEYEKGFDVMFSGTCGKVILDLV